MNSFCAWYSFRMSFWSVPPSRARVDAVRLGVGDEHREDDRRRAVDRHRRGDRAEVDAAVEVLDVGERVDRDTALADLAERERVVGVATHQRRQVERGRESVAARGQQVVEPPVGVDRGAEAREHPHRPELRAVHRRVRPARVRVLARELAVVGPVHGLDRDPRHRGEVGDRAACRVALPSLAACHPP